MSRNRTLFACVIAVVAMAAWLSGNCNAQLFDPPAKSVDEEVDRLSALLESDAPIFDKTQACKRLAFLGSDRCVPAVAAMLGDEKLSHFARYALETIPGPVADKALRDALADVKGRQLAGVVNSIGVRGDRGAVKQVAGLLKSSDDVVASAAAYALGQIATDEAIKSIAEAAANAQGERLASLQDASLQCARQLAARGNASGARRIYESLSKNESPRQVRLSAALGMLRTESKESAGERLAEYLNSKDDIKFEAAIYASREQSDKGVTRALAAAIEGAAEDEQVQLLDALRMRGDAAVVPQIAAAFQSGAAPVKIAALASLGQIGDPKSVPTLIAAAADSNSQIADTAIESLSQLDGHGINEALLKQLPQSKAAEKRVVITVLGRRSAAAAAPALLRLIDSGEEATRIAALEALGQTVSEKEFADLLDRIPAAESEAERTAAIAAVDAACRRMPGPTAVVEAVAKRKTTWPEAHRPALLKVLGAVGGDEALTMVAKAAEDNSPDMQDAATRELGRWMTADAAPHLYKIAASDNQHKTRALRGYLRIARQLNLPDAERLAMCRKALEIAERAEERELALEVMKRCPSAEAVELASSLLDDEELSQRAVETAVFIGEKIKDTDPAAAKSAGQKALEAAEPGELADRARALSTSQ